MTAVLHPRQAHTALLVLLMAWTNVYGLYKLYAPPSASQDFAADQSLTSNLYLPSQLDRLSASLPTYTVEDMCKSRYRQPTRAPGDATSRSQRSWCLAAALHRSYNCHDSYFDEYIDSWAGTRWYRRWYLRTLLCHCQRGYSQHLPQSRSDCHQCNLWFGCCDGFGRYRRYLYDRPSKRVEMDLPIPSDRRRYRLHRLRSPVSRKLTSRRHGPSEILRNRGMAASSAYAQQRKHYREDEEHGLGTSSDYHEFCTFLTGIGIIDRLHIAPGRTGPSSSWICIQQRFQLWVAQRPRIRTGGSRLCWLCCLLSMGMEGDFDGFPGPSSFHGRSQFPSCNLHHRR